ncbi:MAG: DNA repair protein RecO [Clostridia bacterium]|nr:DNA repair protein RecO [Clostridia bacterium]
MALVKTKGLVVKETAFNDTDKMLTLLTGDFGRISVTAKNSRRSGSRAAYGTQVLTYGEYVLFRTKNGFSLNSCDIRMHFFDLCSDLTCFTHAAHMIDMAGDASDDPVAAGNVLTLLLYALQALKKGRHPLLVSSAFALKLMQITGYPPHITSCAACGAKDMETLYFSFIQCGFVCERCKNLTGDSVEVDIGAAKAILHVLCAENSGIFSFELSDQVLLRFSQLAFRYIEERLDKSYRKLDFLKEL